MKLLLSNLNQGEWDWFWKWRRVGWLLAMGFFAFLIIAIIIALVVNKS